MTKNMMDRIKRPSRRKFISDLSLGTIGMMGSMGLAGTGGFHLLSGYSQTPIGSRENRRMITRPPGYHWFGYYDKWQLDPTGRFALSMQVDFEHRSPEIGRASCRERAWSAVVAGAGWRKT